METPSTEFWPERTLWKSTIVQIRQENNNNSIHTYFIHDWLWRHLSSTSSSDIVLPGVDFSSATWHFSTARCTTSFTKQTRYSWKSRPATFRPANGCFVRALDSLPTANPTTMMRPAASTAQSMTHTMQYFNTRHAVQLRKVSINTQRAVKCGVESLLPSLSPPREKRLRHSR